MSTLTNRPAPVSGPGMPPASAPTGPSADPPADDDAEVAARLRLAVTRMARRLRQQVAGGMTSSQVSAMATIERLGTPTLGELAASEQVQPPSMTKMVVGLESAGLVVRREDDSDGRIVRVALTAEGRRAVQRSRSLRNAYLVRRLRRLPDSERARLAELVELLEHLVEEP